ASPGQNSPSNGVIVTLGGNGGWAAAPGLTTVCVEGARQSGTDSVAPSAAPDPPGPAEERIERLAVHELLDHAAKRRICVVLGAAGWGKTTAVAASLRDRPTAWL